MRSNKIFLTETEVYFKSLIVLAGTLAKHFSISAKAMIAVSNVPFLVFQVRTIACFL